MARRRVSAWENIHAILYHLPCCHARECLSPKALCYQSHPSPPRGTYARCHGILLALLIFAVGSVSRLHYQSTHWGESSPYNPIAGGVWRPFICTELEGGEGVSYDCPAGVHYSSCFTDYFSRDNAHIQSLFLLSDSWLITLGIGYWTLSEKNVEELSLGQ